jgi:hypothetical protein
MTSGEKPAEGAVLLFLLRPLKYPGDPDILVERTSHTFPSAQNFILRFGYAIGLPMLNVWVLVVETTSVLLTCLSGCFKRDAQKRTRFE